MSSARSNLPQRRITSLLLAACLALTSCGGGADPEEGPVALALGKSSVEWKASSMFVDVTASGSWTISLETGDGTPWAQVEPASGKGPKSNVVLSYSENKSEQNRELKVILQSGSRSSSATLVQGGRPAEPGLDPGAGYDGRRYGADVSTCGWLELPATVSDGRDFFATYMNMSGAKVRNYSYDWDYSNLVSWWVAYPLNKELMGSGGRSNAWGIDPNMPLAAQSNISMRGFNPSGTFARGHQCPSADRLCSVEANAQTFYGTNMTPQMHVFNEGIWVSLENRVRNWANALTSKTDTLYVVTGCVLGEKSTEGRHGEVGGYALDNDGKKVAIPTGYYKALLRYQKNSTYGYSGFTACGFYFDHKDYGGAGVSKSHAMSIDELEQKTGIDFFVNLVSAIGESEAAKVEAQNPQNVGIWW